MPRTTRKIWMQPVRLFVLALTLAGVVGCGASSTASAPNAAALSTAVSDPLTTAVPAPEGTMTANLPIKSVGKLSARLAQLAAPELSVQDPAAQAGALSLPASGSGSLMRNDKGDVLVVIRANDTSTATQQAIQAAGATITQTTEQMRSFTAYIQPAKLNDLAAIPAVENVREELQP